MSFLLVLTLEFLLSFALTWLWLQKALQHHWFDHPNFRSAHSAPVPRSGGIGFVFAFTALSVCLYWQNLLELTALLSILPGLALAATGLADDFSELSISTRLGVQIVVVIFVLYLMAPSPLLILPEITLQPGVWFVPVLVLAILWFINLFNFMDGLDAFAASEAIFICLALALFSGANENWPQTLLNLGLAAAVSGFLYFNLPAAKLFMGDIGSNFLGLVLAVLALLALENGAVNIWTLLVLPASFLIDSTVTLLARMRAGLVWYHGHNSHAYQRAAKILDSHAKVVLGVAVINGCWILPISWATLKFEQAGFLLVMVAWMPLFFLVRYIRRH